MRLIANGTQGPTTMPTPAVASGTPGFAYNNLPGSGASVTDLYPDDVNIILAELINILKVAGVTPDSTGASVNQVIASMRQLFGVYAADSGAVNALVVTPSPALLSLSEPLRLRVKPAYTNTGAATITVNGVGPVAITNAAGGALTGGELVAGYQVELLYSAAATSFILVAPAYAAANSFRNMAVYTTSGATLNGSSITWTNGGAWTAPAGVTRFRARGVGGGGGAGSYFAGNADMPGCGGGGGYFEGIYTTAPGTNYVLTVGAGGAGGTSGGNGSAGGTTSFGAVATALGGGGGLNGANPAGGIGGTSSGGLINIQGGDGTDGLFVNGVTTSSNIQGGPGLGGSTPLGNGGRSGSSGGSPGRGYGGGGGAPYDGGSTTYAGAPGAPGAIIVEY